MSGFRTALFDDPRALALVVLLLVTAGIAALFTMAQEEDPKIVNRVAIVLTPFPGASAERVERLVTQRIEEAVIEIDEVDEIRSSSRNGLSSVTIVLADEVTDNAAAFSKARDEVGDVASSLPAGAGEPQLIDDRGYAYSVLAGLVWDSASPPNPLILKRTAEELQARLRQVPGTEFTAIHGVGEEEIAVTFAPDIAQSLGVSEARIARALADADAKGAAGQVFSQENILSVEVGGELDTLTRIRAVALAEGRDGAQVRIGDVASVRRGLAEPEAQTAVIDGARGVVVGTRMRTGLRIGAWASSVRDELAAFEAELPAGIVLVNVFDQSAYAAERFGTLATNLAVGIGLVVLILFFTLGWRAALIVTAAIPLTALATLAVMSFVGIPIHQMSVTGMIVALGLLVDAAIVVCDSVERRVARGLGAREAVAESVSRLWLPLLSSTTTTVLAFMPITLLPGSAGEFVGPIADSVIIALIVSLILALTVVAALAGRFLKPRGKGGQAETKRGASSIGHGFERLLRLSLSHPRLSILCALILPVAGFVGVTSLPSQFFPAADRNQFHVQLRLSPQSSLAATKAATERADDVLRGHEGVARVQWFVGDSAPAFYYNLRQNQDGNRNFAEAMVTASRLRGLDDVQDALQDELARTLPDAQVLVRKIVQGPPTEAPIELRITGPDLAILKRLGEEARAILAEVPEVTGTTASVAGGEPKLWIDADEDAALRAGLSLGAVADALSAKLSGARGGSVVEGESELPVIVRLGEEERGSIEELGSTLIASPGVSAVGGVPLSALGPLRLSPAAAEITRYEGERVNTVLGYVRADALPSTAVLRFKQLVAERGFEMPPGYRYAFGGDDEARSEAVGKLLASVGLIVTAAIAVLVLTFGSFRLGALVLLVAALSMGLGMLSLTIFRFPFGFQPIIALMGLMGVAINAAIIILSGLKTDPLAASGDREAVLSGTMETVRHITSTTLTTFAGFLPLILSEGKFWPPFATAIAGGVVLSTVVSFFLVPQAFLLMTRRRPFVQRADGQLVIGGVRHEGV